MAAETREAAPRTKPEFPEVPAEFGTVARAPEILPALRRRLRRPPSRSTVLGSLPVLFFGDLFTARIATLGLNPSHQEYLTRSGDELTGASRRFETLTSLGARDRALLTDDQCDRAIQRMRDYFRAKETVYTRWFKPLDRVCQGMGYHFDKGEVAHLDLVQEATSPTWSDLAKTGPGEHTALREADLPFLLWELRTFPVQAVVCNGRTALDALCAELDVQIVETNAFQRIQWYGRADCAGRTLGVVGWNRPLARPPGLSASDQYQLGELLGSRLRQLGAL